MPSIKFTLKALKPSGKQQLFMTINIRGQAKKYTGYLLESKGNWNKKDQRVKSGNHMPVINGKIREWRSKFIDFIDACDRDEKMPQIQEVFDYVLSEKKRGRLTLPEAFDLYTKSFILDVDITKDTIEQYDNVKGDLLKYSAAKKITLYANEFSNDDSRAFRGWLALTKNNVNDTSNRKIGRIATILRYAASKKIISGVPVLDKFDAPPTRKKSLLLAEWKTLKSYNPPSKEQRENLDIFLFACETGLRYSDLMAFSTVQVQQDEEGKFINVLQQVKTGRSVRVPLSDYVLYIIAKYEKEGKMFKRITSQKLNQNLKVIFKGAGLNRMIEDKKTVGKITTTTTPLLYEKVGIHMARHSYITLQIEMGVSIKYAQLNAGQTSHKTTEKYVHIADMPRMRATRTAFNSH